jgi:hypothetical protein
MSPEHRRLRSDAALAERSTCINLRGQFVGGSPFHLDNMPEVAQALRDRVPRADCSSAERFALPASRIAFEERLLGIPKRYEEEARVGDAAIDESLNVPRMLKDVVENDKVVTSQDEVRDNCSSVPVAESEVHLTGGPLDDEIAKLVTMHAGGIAAQRR